VNVPLYIFHRKYGSIKSNVKFDTDEELDSFVVWLSQKCGKHISVAEPLLDATIPDGSRLNATLGSTSPSAGPRSPSGVSRRTRSRRSTFSASRP
jgi:type IV secretory pathway ATPase VirB11/archaellum biosynthesis ATPase